MLKGWSYISTPSPPTLLFPPLLASFLALIWHPAHMLAAKNPKGSTRKQFSAGLTARNVHRSSKTALFGSRNLLAWLPSGEASSQAPKAAQEEQWDFQECLQQGIAAPHLLCWPRGIPVPWRGSQPASPTKSRQCQAFSQPGAQPAQLPLQNAHQSDQGVSGTLKTQGTAIERCLHWLWCPLG